MSMILVIGHPGTGKSRAIKDLDPATTFIIQPNKKALPFRGFEKGYSWRTESNRAGNRLLVDQISELAGAIMRVESRKAVKTLVVEDLTHFFNAREMKDRKINGYGKWGELAADTFDALIGIEKKIRDDLDVIIIGHVATQQDADGASYEVLQTSGKMLDNKIRVQSYFSYILHSRIFKGQSGVEYRMQTNADGVHEAKSPEGCFDMLVENNYKIILDKIHAYNEGK